MYVVFNLQCVNVSNTTSDVVVAHPYHIYSCSNVSYCLLMTWN